MAFLNNGGRGDAFFQPLTDFMQAAADDLGFELEVFYGDRLHVLYDENIRKIFARERLPDYLIGLEARGSGSSMMRLAEAHGLKTIIINQGFLGENRTEFGYPGEKCKYWLLEFIPDDIQAGYLLATTLIKAARTKGLADASGMINMVAIGGHPQATSAQLRDKGLAKALQENPDVCLLQLCHADWDRERARRLASGLLDRYPQATVVWSASDLMGEGVVNALRMAGKTPGEDVLTGGVDWAKCGLDMVRSGDFESSVGGHFMDGAWALVMLYDSIHGVDISKFSRSKFSRLTKDNIEEYLQRFGSHQWEDIDFCKFSKHLNPEITEYSFNLDGVLRQFKTE